MQQTYDEAFQYLMKSEGGFVNDPRDSGGVTNWGVTKAAWEDYLGRSVTIDEMKALTQTMVKPFYKDRYWNTAGCDAFQRGVDYVVFDFSVNAGVRRSIKCLQQAIGADPDGILGSVTQALLQQQNALDLIPKFSAAKRAFYEGLNKPAFLKGWLNRVDEVEKNALNMVKNG